MASYNFEYSYRKSLINYVIINDVIARVLLAIDKVSIVESFNSLLY